MNCFSSVFVASALLLFCAWPMSKGAALVPSDGAKLPSGMPLSPLSPPPDWAELDCYQKTITRALFTQLINQVYSPAGDFWKFAESDDQRLLLYEDTTHRRLLYTLKFASSADKAVPVPSSFHTRASGKDPLRPLAGIKIALDPGHIGGDWARMEERYFRLGNDPPICEADLTLRTCKILADLLHADGAEVVWAKKDFSPVTKLRPNDLLAPARAWLIDQHPQVVPSKAAIEYQAKMLFYRTAEIRARAEVLSRERPDCTVCVHYNADPWGDPNHPSLTGQSRLVIFANGSYEASELKLDDIKFFLMKRLLSRTAEAEEKGCALIGQRMLDLLGYPPEKDRAYFSHRITGVPSVYTRNLLAGRIYPGPVFFCEGPYMNARDAYHRLQAGDYLGRKTIEGQQVPSIFRVYATAVEQGLLEYFR